MARAFSISLNTNIVFPQPVGLATSAVNGWQRDHVMTIEQASSLSAKSQKRGDDRTQCGDQQGGEQVDQVVLRLTSVAILYATRALTIARGIHRSTVHLQAAATDCSIYSQLPSLPPSLLPGGTGRFRGGEARTNSHGACAERMLSRCDRSKIHEIASSVCFMRLVK